MDLLQKPCEPKETVYFDYGNLIRFLEFLDVGQSRTQTDIQQIKVKIKLLDIIEQQIKDIYHKIEVHSKRIEVNETSIFKHHQKLMELEVQSNLHFELIQKNEDEINSNKNKIQSLDDNLKNVINLSNEHTLEIKYLKENVNHLIAKCNNQTITIEKHDVNLQRLNDDFQRVPKLEDNLNTYKDKIKQKFVKNRNKFHSALGQISTKFSIIENFMKDIAKETKNRDKSLEMPSLKFDDETLNMNLLNINKESKEFLKKQEFEEKYKIIKNHVETHEEQIISLKNSIITLSDEKFNRIESPIIIDKERKKNSKTEKQLKELNEKFLEFEELNKLILKHIEGKVSRDELENTNKQLFLHIERMNQKTRKISKGSTSDTYSKEGHNAGNNMNETEQNIISSKVIEDFKKSILQGITESDLIEKIIKNQQDKEEEIRRINDSMKMIQLQILDQSVLIKEYNAIQSKIMELELLVKNNTKTIEEVKSKDIIEDVITNPLENQQVGLQRMLSIRDHIINLMNKTKEQEEKLDRINMKIENINQDIILKIKKDLYQESNRIMEDFRNDLKNSISRIEEKLREKVDKFNLDEFSKKLDMKILHEVSKKLDKTDMNKNTHVINKKIDSLENKISKTLVDALIDLQLEDAPLIIKKSLQGSDKCASCNQYIPIASSNNLLNHHNHQNMNNLHQQEKSDKMPNFNSTVHNKRFLQKTPLESSEEIIPLGKKRFDMSSVNFHLPDLAQSSSVNKSIGKYNKPMSKENFEKPSRLKKVSTASNLNISQPLMSYDEISEKQLNNIISNELEKKIINPENLMRATKKIYENIDKKYKDK